MDVHVRGPETGTAAGGKVSKATKIVSQKKVRPVDQIGRDARRDV